MNEITIEGYAGLQDLAIQLWWYLEDVPLYDELSERERAKVLNYFFKNFVDIQ